MRQELNDVKAAVSVLQTDLGTLKTDVSELKTITRNTAVIVAGHTEAFVRIEQQLTKLDELDGIKKCLNELNIELEVSHRERQFRRKHFSDQQATLTDHELRLTRIELRSKQS